MIIVDPATLGDATCTRPSVKWVWDRTGTLVEVPADTLAVTYDPSDLSKAPYASVDLEPETNHIRNNTMQGAALNVYPTYWAGGGSGASLNILGKGAEDGIEYVDLRAQSSGSGYVYLIIEKQVQAALGENWFASAFLRIVEGSLSNARVSLTIEEYTNTGVFLAGNDTNVSLNDTPSKLQNHIANRTLTNPSAAQVGSVLKVSFSTAGDVTLRVGLPHLCRDKLPAAPIKTSNGAVTRAADVIGPTAGLIYSNVPMVEPPYDAAVTYAKDVLVRDPVTHAVYQSLIDANKGKPLTDEASWNSRGKTNRWAMFDEYNNTQTTNPEEIVIVLSPQSICEGLYFGNVDADEIELVVVDQSEGKVYAEVTSLVTASGSSSYYDWCFRPADRADYYFTVEMPPYASSLFTVVLRKPGGVAKCGMAVIGLVDDFGPSLYGLSASGKDFSSTTFNFDGTSKTQLRDYAKQMNVDVQVNNGEIDYIQRKLFQLRQRPIVWIGGPYGATAVFGRYVSFDIVIPGLLKSDMSLQIEGSV